PPGHFGQAPGQQFLRVERRLARQQFVEQDSQTINVRPRINVQAGHLRLFRAHIRRRADELLEGREERLVRERPGSGLGDSKINNLWDGHAVVDGDEYVGRFDIPMDEAFLVRVLDGLAYLGE